MRILAFYSPYPGAGKTTAARHFNNKYRFGVASFSEPIRDFVRDIVYGRLNRHDHIPKDEPIWPYDFTQRDLMRAIGQSLKDIYSDIWVDMLRFRIYSPYTGYADWAVDDLRFPNEYAMLRANGAKIVRLTRRGFEIKQSETEAQLEGYDFDAEVENDGEDWTKFCETLDDMYRRLECCEGGWAA